MSLVKNKRGWLKIIESLVAILLVMAIVLVVADNENTRRDDSSELFHGIEKGILNEIQLNSTLRQEILGAIPGAGLNDNDFPALIKAKILSKIPSYIDCTALICNPSDSCVLTNQRINQLGIEEKDIFVEGVMITATQTTFSPRVLKLFCWQK